MKNKILFIILTSIFILTSCSSNVVQNSEYIASVNIEQSKVVLTGGNTKITDFNTSKKVLRKIYEEGGTEIYCGCKFNGSIQIDKKNCPYTGIERSKRSSSIEWEHVVPAFKIGTSPGINTWNKSCGINKTNRECAFKDNKSKYALVDLYNLMPSIGDLNLMRSNIPYGEVTKKEKTMGCEFYKETINIDKKNKITVVEPSDNSKGRVARTSLYMNASYGIQFSKKEMAMFNKWNSLYPPSTEECQVGKDIEKYQGNKNSFLSLCK